VVETTRLLSEETATAELKSVAEALKKTHVVKEPVVVARAKPEPAFIFELYSFSLAASTCSKQISKKKVISCLSIFLCGDQFG
jgi:hypothetical protein